MHLDHSAWRNLDGLINVVKILVLSGDYCLPSQARHGQKKLDGAKPD